MPVTFQGGQALPAAGTAAYNAAASSGVSGTGNYNASTGALTVSQNNGNSSTFTPTAGWSPTIMGATGGTSSAPISPTVTPSINASQVSSVNPLQVTPTTPLSDIYQFANNLVTQQPPTQEENQRSSLETTLNNLYSQEGQKANRFDALNSQFNVPNMTQQLNDLNLQIAQRKNFFTQQTQTAEDKAIPTPFIVGEQSQIQRQSAIELGALAATAQALQGNITLANSTIDRTLQMEFEPVENQINQTKTLLDLNYQDLTTAEKKRADATNMLLNQQQKEVDDLKDAKKTAYTAVINSNVDANTKQAAALAISQANNTDDVFSITAKYAVPKPSTQVVEVGGNNVLIDTQTGNVIKTLGPKDAASAAINLTGANKSLGDAFNSAIVGIPGTQLPQIQSVFNNYVANGDIDGAKDYIIRVALKNAPVADQTAATGRNVAIDSLNDIKSLIQQANAEGAGTSLTSGTIQNVQQKLGNQGNPDLVDISEKIALALNTYRKATTGVAFSPQEAAQYAKIFPSLTDASDLNTTKIDSLVDAFNQNNRSVLSTYIGSKTYDAVFGPKSNPVLPSSKNADVAGIGDKITTAQSHGYSTAKIFGQLNQIPSVASKIQQALSAGYSQDDILNFLKQK